MERASEIFAKEISELVSLQDGAAGEGAVRSLYLRLAKKYHPDANGAPHEYMSIVNAAYEKKRAAAGPAPAVRGDPREKTARAFDYRKFASLFARCASRRAYYSNNVFSKNARALVEEIAKSDEAAAAAFGLLLSKEMTRAPKYELCHKWLGCCALRHRWISRPPSAAARERIADGFLADYLKSCREHPRFQEIEPAALAAREWLKTIAPKY